MKHLGDIIKIHGCTIPTVDVAVGGSPCQDLSIAGIRAGMKHYELGDEETTRSGLYMEQIRVIKELRYEDRLRGRTGELIRPRFMVWENVPGAFSSNQGEDFRVVLEETARVAQPDAVIPGPPGGKWRSSGCVLGDGWSIAWRVLDAQFWGVPQRRRRIALVADFGGHAAPEILFIRKGVSWDFDPGGTAGEGPAGGAAGGAGGAGVACLTPWDTQSARVYSPHGVWHSLNANENGGQARDAVLVRAFHLTQDPISCVECAPCLSSGNPRNGQATIGVCAFMGGQGAKARSIGHIVECSPTLKSAPSGGNTVPCVYENHGQDSRLTGPLEVAQTVARKFGTGGNNTPLVMASGQSGAELLENVSPTLNCNHEQPLVAHTLRAKANLSFREDSDTLICEAGPVAGLDCRNGTENAELCAALQAKEGGGQSLNCTHPVRVGQTVRRLTPLECERLQGYPDGWTEVGLYVDALKEKERGKMVQYPTAWEKGMRRLGLTRDGLFEYRVRRGSDSARYQALGNSIALPPWAWVMKRIAACYERPATLGSFFDGIGGFPLIWERLNGPGSCLWASEIEAFPMAVTRAHFGGDVW